MITYILICILSVAMLNVLVIKEYGEHLLKDVEVTRTNWYSLVLSFFGAPLLLIGLVMEIYIVK